MVTFVASILALVDVVAFQSVALVTGFTGTREASLGVAAVSVLIAVIGLQIAFVDV